MSIIALNHGKWKCVNCLTVVLLARGQNWERTGFMIDWNGVKFRTGYLEAV